MKKASHIFELEQENDERDEMKILERGWAIFFSCAIALLIYSQGAEASWNSPAPELTSSGWINSEPKSLQDLRGQVVLVEFWTFGCYNCRNVQPQIKKWHQAFSKQGLEVIGIHSPEFAYEKDFEAVKRYVRENDIRYAVVTDNDFSIWNRYGNHYWPAIYLIDKKGMIRYTRIGEGGYSETENKIQELLAEGR